MLECEDGWELVAAYELMDYLQGPTCNGCVTWVIVIADFSRILDVSRVLE